MSLLENSTFFERKNSIRFPLIEFARFELLLRWRLKGQWIQSVSFFVLINIFFPLALGPEKQVLKPLVPGLLWLAALLALLLSLETLFKEDFVDGTLAQLLLSDHTFEIIIFIKIIMYWCASSFLLVLVSPFVAYALGFPLSLMGILMLSLLIGTATLTLFAAMAAALTVNFKRRNLLMAMISLPFYVPILIFGVACVQRALNEQPWLPILAILLAILLFGLVILPWASAAILRLNLRT